MVEKLRLIETELAGALSADLRAALAFSRGAAGVPVTAAREKQPMYELFTLGGGTYLVDLLNAVAAITGGGRLRDAGPDSPASRDSPGCSSAPPSGDRGRTTRSGCFSSSAVWGALVVPKATVRVVDRLDPALAPAVVANVPLGLALFASHHEPGG